MLEKKGIFSYISGICFPNYLALLNTTQWWFRWQKIAPDWLWGGLVHLNLCIPGSTDTSRKHFKGSPNCLYKQI